MAKKKVPTNGFDVEEFAKELIDFWSKDPTTKDVWQNRGVDVASVASGLNKLIDAGELSLNVLADITGTSSRIELAVSAIKFAQGLGSGLNPDGILGRKTRSFLERWRRGCNHQRPSKKIPADSRANGMDNIGLLLFHIAPDLDSERIGSADVRVLLDEAIVAWTSRLMPHLKLHEVDDPHDANISMFWHNFDGPGGVLADAHIGGPGRNQRLELRFDENESWTAKKFQTTAMHELGHILGLDHAGASAGDLMSPLYDEGISEPTQNDVSRVRKIWAF